MITLAQLIACGIGPTPARAFLDHLNTTIERFEIASPAMFIAQAAHESVGFTKLEEDLYYKDPVRLSRDIFRSAFDVDHDKLIDNEEIEFAKFYTRNPQALANRAYADRLGNGDEASGDGWKYRGRGIFQLTGRNNYTAAAAALSADLVDNPDLVAQPEMACITAGWFWASNGLNQFGESLTVEMATRKINGPRLLHLDERRVAYIEAQHALAA
jgi:putative chitinase